MAPSSPIALAADPAAAARAPAGPPEAAGWRAVAVLLFAYAVALLDRQVLYLMVDPVRAALGIDDVQMGLLQGLAFAVFYVACGVPLGWAADRWSRRWIILGGLVVWGLATAGCGLARTFPQLLAARFVVGVGEAALLPAAYSMIGDFFPRARVTTAMSVFSTGAMVGAGAALGLGGVLVTFATRHGPVDAGVVGVFQPWQIVFFLTATPAIVLAPLLLLMREPVRRETVATTANPQRVLPFLASRRRFLACHFLGFGLIYLVSAASSAWAPTYMTRHFHWSTARIGSSFGLLVIVFGIAGMLISGRTVSRWFEAGRTDAHLRYPAMGALVLALIGWLAPHVGSPWLAILLFGSVSFFTTVVAMAVAALHLTTPSHFRGRMSALFLVVFNLLGVGGGPLVVALLTEHVFHDERRIGDAISVSVVVGALAAATLLRMGMPLMRRAVSSHSDGATQA